MSVVRQTEVDKVHGAFEAIGHGKARAMDELEGHYQQISRFITQEIEVREGYD
jgi:hypothetical protein